MPYSDDENDDYSRRSSVFSEKPSTASTRPSTIPSKASSSGGGYKANSSKIGKSLRTSQTENLEQDTYRLKLLSEQLLQAMDLFDLKTPTLIAEALNKYEVPLRPQDFFSASNKEYLASIVRVILTLADNVLANETYRTLRLMVLKSFHMFYLRCLQRDPGYNLAIPEPANFCLVDEGATKISAILDAMVETDSLIISDQEGAFLAPVARGFSEELAVPAIVCGFPTPKPEHYELAKLLCQTFPDIHFMVQKNSIRVCGGASTMVAPGLPFTGPEASNFGGIIPPFRIPGDPNNIPISLLIAANSNNTLSGTLGGYIYPKIDVKKNNFLAEDAKATYAMTCAHVCIDDQTLHPYVSVPSPVLVRMYKEALVGERNKYPPYSQEYNGYNNAYQYLEQRFPPITNSTANTPGSFGRVIFGERSIVNGRLSDIAIIKCNPNVNCMNHLGTDFPFSQYDPALMFGNLQIKKVISKIRPGSLVFKFGSTTKFTTGKLSKPKLVYWADNRIQSSEFVIASDRPGFASGGDSGAWILQKLEDFEAADEEKSSKTGLGTIYEKKDVDEVLSGLGVVGMLHAYDGEFKQFGLYLPIVLVLNRLQELTKVPWGVVGVVDEKDYQDAEGESSEEEDSSEEDDDME